MSAQFWSGDRSRRIIRRIVVEADMTLLSPTHVGSGEGDELKDMPLLVDAYDGKSPLLPGASLAGAMRAYLRELEQSSGETNPQDAYSIALFGGAKGDDDGLQSPLIIEDSVGKNAVAVLRDGVSLDATTRTATDGKLFDIELWQAGTLFPLRLELLITEGEQAKEARLKEALASALQGLSNGSIALGMRKSRGYGQVKVNTWRVKTYDLTTNAGLLDWLENGAKSIEYVDPLEDITTALSVVRLVPDKRKLFSLNASFWLDGSLLIRAGTGKEDQGPDSVHLYSRHLEEDPTQNGEKYKPVISGTSLAGALRARAQKIANTLAPDRDERVRQLINLMFGTFPQKVDSVDGQKGNHSVHKPPATASKLIVRESHLKSAEGGWVQNRVSLDRFSGGAREAALFSEQPVFGDENSRLEVELMLRQPEPHEIGLLLLLLKDLWTGDLPIGGEIGVGRGRLQGVSAEITIKNGSAEPDTWCFQEEAGKLLFTEGEQETLEDFVDQFTTWLEEVES